MQVCVDAGVCVCVCVCVDTVTIVEVQMLVAGDSTAHLSLLDPGHLGDAAPSHYSGWPQITRSSVPSLQHLSAVCAVFLFFFKIYIKTKLA